MAALRTSAGRKTIKRLGELKRNSLHFKKKKTEEAEAAIISGIDCYCLDVQLTIRTVLEESELRLGGWGGGHL